MSDQPSTPSFDPLALPVPKAADAIGVSVSTLRRLLRRHELRTVSYGKRGFAVLYSDLRRLVESRIQEYKPARYKRDFKAKPSNPAAQRKAV